MKLLSAKALKIIFDDINKDCLASGESEVPFFDIEYYADQIFNIFEYPQDDCSRIANEMAAL